MGKTRILSVFAAMLLATGLVACGSSTSTTSEETTATETGTVTFRGGLSSADGDVVVNPTISTGTPSEYRVQPLGVWIYKGGSGCTAFNSADTNWAKVYPVGILEGTIPDVCKAGFVASDATDANAFFDLSTNPSYGDSNVPVGTYSCMYVVMCDQIVGTAPSSLTACYNSGEKHSQDVWNSSCYEGGYCAAGGTDDPQGDYTVYFGTNGKSPTDGGRGLSDNPFVLNNSVVIANPTAEATAASIIMTMTFDVTNMFVYNSDNIEQPCYMDPPTISIVVTVE